MAPEIVFENGKNIPLCNIFCVGRNYREHAQELGNDVPTSPIFFLKSTRSLRSLKGEDLAFSQETFHHEVELVLAIGKRVSFGEKGSWQAVSGIALGLDLTRREEQSRLKAKGLPWTTAKNFCGAAIVSDFIPLASFNLKEPIYFHLKVNGELRQQGRSSHMIFDVESILTHLAQFHPLDVGDIVFTGTPSGVNEISQGDRFEMELENPQRSFVGVL